MNYDQWKTDTPYHDEEPIPPPTPEEEAAEAWEYWHQRSLRLEAALKAMLDQHGKPHREEWINEAAFEQAKAVDAQARAALASDTRGTD